MDWIRHAIYLIPLFPLFGAVVNLLLGRKLGRPAVFGLACGSVFVSFLFSVAAFLHLASLPPAARSFTDHWYTWIQVGDFKANAAFLVDPLSAVMLLVVTGVGFLIHLYSVGYMGDDESPWRYFGFLNLFVFAMLTLVLADNFLLMFIGWEGVGLCSYLLIGYWYKEKKNTDAGKKAFVVNRIGDWGFLAGVLLLFWEIGGRAGVWSVTFTELKASVGCLSGATWGGISVATLAGILLFIGASGKSAQIPLYVWLPDAMAGPTPVSALIHAATMVTAGVYMIGRVHFVYDLSPVALGVVAAVGGATALYAATIGLVQNDIKKVLAYSTVSQLGYMFLAMGVGAYSAGIFHLMTHAFFKACLFLGSGSVILACHHQQDIRRMGGLRKQMPTTYWTFLASTLAISGIFPLSGFFSKDEILWQAFAGRHGSPLLWVLGAGAALLTAFYMFRLVYVTFHGRYRGNDPVPGAAGHAAGGAHDAHGHAGIPSESPRVITFPLQVLAVLAILAGFLNVPTLLGGAVGWRHSDTFHEWLTPVFAPAPAYRAGEMGRAAPGEAPRPHGAAEPASLAEAVHSTGGAAGRAGADPAPASLAEAVQGTGAAAGRAEAEPAPASLTEAVRSTEGAAAGKAGPAPAEDAHPAGAAAGGHPATGGVEAGAGGHNPGLEFGLMLLSLAVALTGIWVATRFYLRNPEIPARLAGRMQGVYALLLNKYYVDEIYQAVIVDNFYRLMRAMAWFDNAVIDGLVNLSGRLTVLWSWLTGKFDNIVVDGWGVNGLAAALQAGGRNLRQLQTGKVQGYLLVALLGLLGIIVFRIL